MELHKAFKLYRNLIISLRACFNIKLFFGPDVFLHISQTNVVTFSCYELSHLYFCSFTQTIDCSVIRTSFQWVWLDLVMFYFRSSVFITHLNKKYSASTGGADMVSVLKIILVQLFPAVITY